jgi:chromosome partitioning protein
MTKIITVAQHKGGTGKTITCVNLGASLAELGKSVLLVDLDPQASLSISVGVNPVDLKYSMHEVMGNQSFAMDQIIVDSELPNLSVAPSDIKLALVEMQLASSIGREKVLHKKLAPIKDNYDFILLDSPPSLGLLTVNALAAGDEVLIPVQCHPLSLYGVKHLLQVINTVREELNVDLTIIGVLLTMYDKRTKLSQDVAKKVGDTFKDLIFETIINQRIKLAEGAMQGLPITSYATSSEGAAEYRSLARELLKRESQT